MSTTQATDEQQLIDRAREGSVDAFEQLVLKYQDRLYRFLLVRSANRADAEDALQEAFVAAFKYLPSYRDRYRFSTWLFTIAIRHLGRLGRQQTTHSDLPDDVACERPGPEQLGMQMQNRQSLWQTARTCLGDSQFTALWLFYIEEMPIAEIGVTIRRPVSWVKVNLMRSRRRLSRTLQTAKPEQADSLGEVTL